MFCHVVPGVPAQLNSLRDNKTTSRCHKLDDLKYQILNTTVIAKLTLVAIVALLQMMSVLKHLVIT